MKKRINKPMRAAGVLLVATMLTTCMTAGTFAKYTTTDSATDSARVAKFGVTIATNGSLFGKEYSAGSASASTGTPTVHTGNTNTGTVQAYSTSSMNVVAPGTNSSGGLGLSLNGTPEVDVSLTYHVFGENIRLSSGQWAVLVPIDFTTKTELVNYVNAGGYSGTNYGASGTIVRLSDATLTDDNRTFELVTTTNAEDAYTNKATKKLYKISTFANVADNYFPVQYKLTYTGGATTESVTTNTMQTVVNKYATLLKNGAAPSGFTTNGTSIAQEFTTATTKVSEANVDVDTAFSLGNSVLSWKWDFTNDDSGATDAKDTILGDLVAQKNHNNVNTNQSNDTFEGIVVKWDSTSYKIPEMDTTQTVTVGTTNYTLSKGDKDFNLDTEFYIDVTVTQVD